MTTAMIREIPDGYTNQYDSDTWNVGEVFHWSDVYDCWLDCEVRLTIHPNMTIEHAFEIGMDHPMWDGYAVFFNSSF